jgi:hypothetical protein
MLEECIIKIHDLKGDKFDYFSKVIILNPNSTRNHIKN